MGIEQIWLLEKLIRRFKIKPIRTSIEIVCLISLFVVICYFGVGYLPEKGRQLASDEVATDSHPSTTNGTKKLVTISAGEITLSGPGSCLVDTENKANSDDLKKIYGLSEGDKITLKAADDDRTIVIKKGHYLKMRADFSLDNKDDFIILISKGSNICAQYQREDIGD